VPALPAAGRLRTSIIEECPPAGAKAIARRGALATTLSSPWISVRLLLGPCRIDSANRSVDLYPMCFARLPYAAALVALLAFGACAPTRYVKAGADEAQVANDLAECADIAAHQAFRDLIFFDRRADFGRLDGLGRRRALGPDLGPSQGELEHRYVRICMLSRGYDLQTREGP